MFIPKTHLDRRTFLRGMGATSTLILVNGRRMAPYGRADDGQKIFTDLSYIPMRRGFVYLAAVVDVFSRRVLAHRVSITMETTFCVEALEVSACHHFLSSFRHPQNR